MSKYLSKAGKKRLVLTTKRASKGFYKGKGGTKEGRLTSKGKFIVDPMKRLELVVPDLTGFKVRFPYCMISWSTASSVLLVNVNVCLTFPDRTAPLQLKPYIASTVSRFPPEEQKNPVPS